MALSGTVAGGRWMTLGVVMVMCGFGHLESRELENHRDVLCDAFAKKPDCYFDYVDKTNAAKGGEPQDRDYMGKLLEKCCGGLGISGCRPIDDAANIQGSWPELDACRFDPTTTTEPPKKDESKPDDETRPHSYSGSEPTVDSGGLKFLVLTIFLPLLF